METKSVSKYYLTNQWSSRPHGHGQSELELAKTLIMKFGIQVEVLSQSASFGDEFIGELRSPFEFLPEKLIRGPIYRWKERSAQNWLVKEWFSRLNNETNSIPLQKSFVLTSSSFEEIEASLKRLSPEIDFYCRITHYQESQIANTKFLRTLMNAVEEQIIHLAFETNDAMLNFSNYSNVEFPVVGPAQGLCDNFTYGIGKVFSLGVIWPLTSYASIEDVEKTLLAIPQDISVLVRLPHRIHQNDLSMTNSKWIFMRHGLSFEEYRQSLSQVKTVFLPHEGYVMKGSGLVFEFLASGIPVLAHNKNAFVRDLEHEKMLVTFDSFERSQLSSKISALLSHDPKQTSLDAEILRATIRNSWVDFLNLGH